MFISDSVCLCVFLCLHFTTGCTPWGRKKQTRRNVHPTHTHEEEEERFTQTTRSALSPRGLLDPIKPAYNQSRLDGRLKLTAGAFNRLDQYARSPGHSIYCYTELAASFINFLHYCWPSSGFYGTKESYINWRPGSSQRGGGQFWGLFPPLKCIRLCKQQSVTRLQTCTQGTARYGESVASEWTYLPQGWQVHGQWGHSSKFLITYYGLWVVGCCRGYLCGARCRLAYGPADATATHCILLQ